MIRAVFRQIGALALGVMVGLAIGLHAFAAERPSDDDVRRQLALFISGGCSSDLTTEEFQSLRPQSFDLDDDGAADPFVDIPTEVLTRHGCDVPSARVVWASSRDYSLGFFTEPSGDAASPRAASAESAGGIPEGATASSSLTQEEAALAGSTTPSAQEPPEAAGSAVADSRGEIPSPAAVSRPSAWMLAGAGAALLVLGIAVVLLLTTSSSKYGYDLLLNRMNFLWIIAVAAAVIGIATRPDGALIAAPIAVGSVGIILFNNIRRTNFLIGTVGTLIQPVALVLILFGLLWLRGLLAGGSGGGGRNDEAGRLQRIRDHERRVQGYVRH